MKSKITTGEVQKNSPQYTSVALRLTQGNTKNMIGILLIAGAVGVLIPYTMLTVNFGYPDILREEAGVVLYRFHAGGKGLIFTWWAFAILGLPLLIAYILIGQALENRVAYMRWVTTLGIISGVAQIIGLLRWVFVVPVLAEMYVAGGDQPAKAAAVTAFKTIHQLGGVLLGEHLGQLFTILWMAMVSYTFLKLEIFPKWLSWLGFAASFIYVFAQADLFATVIPGFPVWSSAGFLGSTLWLIWLIATGILLLRMGPGPQPVI